MLRRTALGAAFALLVGLAPWAQAQADDEAAEAAPAREAPAHEAPAAAAGGDTGDEAAAPEPVRAHHHGKKHHPYKFIGRVVPEDQLRVDPLPRPSGNLAMISINNPKDDPVKVNIYNEDGSYNLDALEQLNHILRDRKSVV